MCVSQPTTYTNYWAKSIVDYSIHIPMLHLMFYYSIAPSKECGLSPPPLLRHARPRTSSHSHQRYCICFSTFFISPVASLQRHDASRPYVFRASLALKKLSHRLAKVLRPNSVVVTSLPLGSHLAFPPFDCRDLRAIGNNNHKIRIRATS